MVVGTQFCALHGDPKWAAELGRMGGLRNRHYVDTEPVSIIPPETPEDVKNVLRQAIADVRAKNWIRGPQPRSPTCPAFFWKPSQPRTCKAAGKPAARSADEGGQVVSALPQDRWAGHGPLFEAP